jgi:hypothetical protein
MGNVSHHHSVAGIVVYVPEEPHDAKLGDYPKYGDFSL